MSKLTPKESLKDLSIQKKADLVLEEFRKFQDGIVEKYGVVMEPQLQATRSSLSAILAIAEIKPEAMERMSAKPTQEEAVEKESTEEAKDEE